MMHGVSVEDMDEETLELELEEAERECRDLRIEQDVFSSFYQKHSRDERTDEEERKRGRNRRRVPTTLTLDQKYDVANSVFEELQHEMESTKKNSEKLIDTLRAVLEETEIRIMELKKDAYEFRRVIVGADTRDPSTTETRPETEGGAESRYAGKIIAEKVVRYWEEKLRQKDALIEKLRLKNSTLKGQIQKVEAQLTQKEEMGDVLHYIDFHQLQIENKQFVARIEERNEELLKLKMTTGKTVQALNSLKQRLNAKLEELSWVEQEIVSKTQQHDKLQAETEEVSHEVTRDRRTRKKLSREQQESVGMPNVEDYIAQKRQMYELQSTMQTWERKVGIMELAATKSSTALRQARTRGAQFSASTTS